MIIVANWKMNGNRALALEYRQYFPSVIVCPPFTLLHHLKGALMGAQDCSAYESGAHTGEVSAPLLKESGCRFVIVGHSERQEPWDMVMKKAKMVLEHQMTPIICVPEYREIHLDPAAYYVTYEPISAIGTGQTPSPEEIAAVTHQLKKHCPKVLYGGSVSSQNAASFKEVCDGFLIGGASLKIDEMKKIIALV